MFYIYRSWRCAVLNHLKLSVSDGKHRYDMTWTLLLKIHVHLAGGPPETCSGLLEGGSGISLTSVPVTPI